MDPLLRYSSKTHCCARASLAWQQRCHQPCHRVASVRNCFLLIAFAQTAVCAIVLGHLCYKHAVDLACQHSADLADQRFEQIRFATDGAVRPLLQAVDVLHTWLLPLAPEILSTRTVANVSGFWYLALHEMRANLAWNHPQAVLYSYGCHMGNISP